MGERPEVDVASEEGRENQFGAGREEPSFEPPPRLTREQREMLEDSQLSDPEEDGGIPASQLEPEIPEHVIDKAVVEHKVSKGFEELSESNRKEPMTLADYEAYLNELRAQEHEFKAARKARFPSADEVIEIPETLPYGDDFHETLEVPEGSFALVKNSVDVKEDEPRVEEPLETKKAALHRSAGLNRASSSGEIQGEVRGTTGTDEPRKSLFAELEEAEEDLFVKGDPLCWAARLMMYFVCFHMFAAFDWFN